MMTLPSKQKGVSIAELSIVMVAFFLVTFGLIEGARAIYTFNIVAHAAKQGVRYIVVRGSEAAQDDRRSADAPASDADIKSYVQGHSSILSDADVDITWTLDGDDNPLKDSGQSVQVTVSTDFFGTTVLIPSLTISSTSQGIIYY
ncbi:TadE/TadG family type IV pilus assembly protein [Vibrio paucivorans]